MWPLYWVHPAIYDNSALNSPVNNNPTLNYPFIIEDKVKGGVEC